MENGVVQNNPLGTQPWPVAFVSEGSVQIAHVANPVGPSGPRFLPGACIAFDPAGGNGGNPVAAPGQCGAVPPPYATGGAVVASWQARKRAQDLALGPVDLGRLYLASSDGRITVPLMKSLGF